MKTPFSTFPLAAVCALMLAGCAATTQLDASWVDPSFKGRSFAGQRVLVTCDAGEQETLRRVCEDRLADEVTAGGGRAVRRATDAPAKPDTAAVVAEAKRAGAVAVVRGNVSAGARTYNSAPQVSIGIGGFGGGRTSVGGSVGVALPAGPGSTSTAYGLDLGISDVASGKLVWSGRATGAPSQDLGVQMAELARTAMAAARAAGVI